MHPALERLRDALEGATRDMDSHWLATHRQGKWSPAEIVEHLLLSYKGTRKGLERVLDAGQPLARRPRLRDRLLTALVVSAGYLPSGGQAPERTRPRGMAAEQVLPAWREALSAMDDALARAEERFGPGTRILDHPILGPLTAEQWRKFHLVHGLHHVKQIEARR